MTQFRIVIFIITICLTWIVPTAHSDEISRQNYEVAHAAYQLQLSAQLLDQTIDNYDPITNPHGAATILTAFDQLANAYMQTNIVVVNYMKIYPEVHPLYAAASQISTTLTTAIQSISMLQTIARGAGYAGLSSYSNVSDITDVVTHTGAMIYVSSVITNLSALGVSDPKELSIVQNIVYPQAQQAALMAIHQKAGDSPVITNSNACLAATGAIATIATYVEGATSIALPKYLYHIKSFTEVFSDELEKILYNNNNNILTFKEQQKSYATAFNAVFAGAFSALISQSSLQPLLSPIDTTTSQTNADKLIEGAYLLAQGISQMILPGAASIVDAMNYASIINSGLLTQRQFELKDLIFIMQQLSGNF
ncbi:MAG: hypothetical protein OMM_01301 [Candidatus Magnetoglobus multicellularis str. Araruama]|uniref:Uncharacterized protein n=1 Tax=Candidatus Magnetoglobus multicellularis str. Araruama TaxID=890399 RepID=A0A1V1PDV7_9BACT|nr:MAG: hypothetical protein OMM_01301 [Candidatus Magnetoglobus multicellularis str. Araruama]